MSTYKPSEHGGKKLDGTLDKRTTPEHGFGSDHAAAVEQGKKGGATQPEEVYKPSEHNGQKVCLAGRLHSLLTQATSSWSLSVSAASAAEDSPSVPCWFRFQMEDRHQQVTDSG